MLLDDLVTAIQTVQARIREHGDSLSQNEYRTRISLIDPILNALGWDVSDPSLVTHEYAVGNGRADYALLRKDGSPTAFIEAKRLGEVVDAARHETQLFTYAVTQGVKYAGLTDGNRWLFDNLTARFSGGESRLLDATISKATPHQCALTFLLLWNPPLATGQPTKASGPILDTPPESEVHIPTQESLKEQPESPFFSSEPQPPNNCSDGIASALAGIESPDLMHARVTDLIGRYINPDQIQNRAARKGVRDYMKSRGFEEFYLHGEWGGKRSDNNRFCHIQLCNKQHALNRR